MKRNAIRKNLVLAFIIVTLTGCAAMTRPDNSIGIDQSPPHKRHKSVSITVPDGSNFVSDKYENMPKISNMREGFSFTLNELDSTYTFMTYVCSTKVVIEHEPYIKEEGTGCYVLAADPEVPKDGFRTTTIGAYTATTKGGVTSYKFMSAPASVKYNDIEPIAMYSKKYRDTEGSSIDNLFFKLKVEKIRGEFIYPHSVESLNAGFSRHFGTDIYPSNKYSGWYKYGIGNYSSIEVKTERFGAGSKATYIINPGKTLNSKDQVNLDVNAHSYIIKSLASIEEIKME